MLKPVSSVSWRVRRQHLAQRASQDAALDVVSDICGLHAQLAASAELTLWARVDGLSRDWVSTALWEDRTLVKTWAMRGTLHLMPADELGLWVGAQAALKPRHHGGAWLRHFGLTREELAVEVARITGVKGLDDKLKGGFGDLLKPAAFRGDLCFAPSDGQRVRFARPDRWLGPWEPVPTEEATLEVARRYLTRYGPASREALARWFWMPSPAEAGRWLKRFGDEAVADDGVYMLAADVEAARAAEPEGDGRMAGVWSHDRKGARRIVEVEPFGRLTRAERAGLQTEAEALAGFLGGELELSLS